MGSPCQRYQCHAGQQKASQWPQGAGRQPYLVGRARFCPPRYFLCMVTSAVHHTSQRDVDNPPHSLLLPKTSAAAGDGRVYLSMAAGSCRWEVYLHEPCLRTGHTSGNRPCVWHILRVGGVLSIVARAARHREGRARGRDEPRHSGGCAPWQRRYSGGRTGRQTVRDSTGSRCLSRFACQLAHSRYCTTRQTINTSHQ